MNPNRHLIVGMHCRRAYRFFLLGLMILTVFVDLSVDLHRVGGETVYCISAGKSDEMARVHYLFLVRPSLAYVTAIQTLFYIEQASALK
jgi:hypothetical protein